MAVALGEVRRSALVADANTMLARATKGGRVDDRQVIKMQQRLLGMERQDEVLGRESEGRQLSPALSDVRRSQLVADAMGVIARAKQGRRSSAEHVAKLQLLLTEMERQDQLEGRIRGAPTRGRPGRRSSLTVGRSLEKWPALGRHPAGPGHVVTT